MNKPLLNIQRLQWHIYYGGHVVLPSGSAAERVRKILAEASIAGIKVLPGNLDALAVSVPSLEIKGCTLHRALMLTMELFPTLELVVEAETKKVNAVVKEQ